jgi:hypothetical protein
MGGPLRKIVLIERLVPRGGSRVFGKVNGWMLMLTLECGHCMYRLSGVLIRRYHGN